MKFKTRYKSCLWSRTDIWGDLIRRKNTFLKVKWDRMIGVLASKKRRRYQQLCKNYNLVRPEMRPNQPYKFPRWAFRNSLSNRVCLRRFYGDLNHHSLYKLARGKTLNQFVEVLEMRLDINLYRLGFFTSIFESRQAILHRKVLVNGQIVNSGAYLLQSGDLVEFCPTFRNYIKSRFIGSRQKTSYIQRPKIKPTPFWIHTDYASLSFIVRGGATLCIFYPFRVELDNILFSLKYGY